jgi:hypothetical protein
MEVEIYYVFFRGTTNLKRRTALRVSPRSAPLSFFVIDVCIYSPFKFEDSASLSPDLFKN